MFPWLKHFVLIPFSLLACFATMIWISAEILALTVWGLLVKTSKAAHAFRRLITQETTPSRIPPLVIGLAAGAVAVWAIMYLGKAKNK